MTAARTTPARSTMTSTMCPMSSPWGCAHRGQHPVRVLCADDGDGRRRRQRFRRRPGMAHSAAGKAAADCDPAVGTAASFCARAAVATCAAHATAIDINKRLARIRALLRRVPPSMRHHDRDLDLAARTQDLQRHIVAVPVDPKIDARSSQLQSRSTTSLRKAGRRGLRSRISPRPTSNSSPSDASSNVNGVALAHACGAHADRIQRRSAPLLAPEAAE